MKKVRDASKTLDKMMNGNLCCFDYDEHESAKLIDYYSFESQYCDVIKWSIIRNNDANLGGNSVWGFSPFSGSNLVDQEMEPCLCQSPCAVVSFFEPSSSSALFLNMLIPDLSVEKISSRCPDFCL